MIRLALCLFVAITGMAAMPAAAQGVTQTDRAAIQARVAAFDNMMAEGRIGESLDFVPPRLLDTIASKFGATNADVKQSFATQVAEMIKEVKFVSFNMNVRAGTTGVTPNKSRNYMLIPTETVIEIPGAGRMLNKSTTLAVEDSGIWYLVRIEGAEQLAFLRETYPEFTGVEFPTGSTTAVK